jgi:hypothetical protein
MSLPALHDEKSRLMTKTLYFLKIKINVWLPEFVETFKLEYHNINLVKSH